MENAPKDERDVLRRPLEGGLALEDSSGTNWCSSGYFAYDRNFNNYLVTAGHCGTELIQYPGGEFIGTPSSAHYYYSGSVDARAIKLADPSHRSYYVYHYSSAARLLTSYDTNGNGIYVGQAICKSGYRTGTTCGTVVKLFVGMNGNTGVPFYDQVGANYTSDGGDSGGTVYSGGMLLGIHKGRSDGMAVFTKVANINSASGLLPYVFS